MVVAISHMLSCMNVMIAKHAKEATSIYLIYNIYCNIYKSMYYTLSSITFTTINLCNLDIFKPLKQAVF